MDATQRAFLKSGKVHIIMADMTRTRIGEALDQYGYADFSKKIATLKVKLFFKNVLIIFALLNYTL